MTSSLSLIPSQKNPIENNPFFFLEYSDHMLYSGQPLPNIGLDNEELCGTI
jgi:hypothetical protein